MSSAALRGRQHCARMQREGGTDFFFANLMNLCEGEHEPGIYWNVREKISLTHLELARSEPMTMPVSPGNLYLSIDEVARRFGVSTDSIRRWANAGNFPKPRKVGPNTTRWKLSEVEAHEACMSTCFAFTVLGLMEATGRLTGRVGA